MNMDSVNKWLTLAANIGVIAGIFFLGMEINQNTESLQAQSSYNYNQVKTNSFRLLVQNPDDFTEIFIKFQSGQALTAAEDLLLRLNAEAMLSDFQWQFNEIQSGRYENDFRLAGNWAQQSPI